jgi:hypothetical protein
MKQSLATGEKIFGIKGVSPFIAIENFDLCHGNLIDIMHCGYIGVTKALMDLLFDSSFHDQPFSLRKFMKNIDSDLKGLSRSSAETRPLNIFEYKNWKANQYRSFVLLSAYPILKQYMQKNYLQNLMHLSFGLYLLSQDSISSDDFDKAKYSLEKFSETFGNLYGQEHMTFNVHLLQHLPACVKNMGPLWAYSLFAFETSNGFLCRILKGKSQVVKELARKYLIVYKYFQNKNTHTKYRTINNVLIPRKSSKPNESTLQMLPEFLKTNEVQEINYFFIDNQYFEREKPNKKTSDHFVILKNGFVGKILKIFETNGEITILFEDNFRITKERCQFKYVKAIKKSSLSYIDIDEIDKKIYLIEKFKCFTIYPNTVEGD